MRAPAATTTSGHPLSAEAGRTAAGGRGHLPGPAPGLRVAALHAGGQPLPLGGLRGEHGALSRGPRRQAS